jgi:hypothetical protein
MVMFDTTTLLVVLAPKENVRVEVGGQLILDARERVDYLIECLEKSKTKVVVPTPALSEALVRAGRIAAVQYLARITKTSAFDIRPFETLAAMEAAIMMQDALQSGDKRAGAKGEWQKIKVDRQIIAIAKVNGVETIYSNDEDIRTLGSKAGLQVVGIEALPLPPEKAQFDLQLSGSAEGGQNLKGRGNDDKASP